MKTVSFGTYCYFCGYGYGIQTNLGCTGDETSRPLPFKDKTNFYNQDYEPHEGYTYWCGQCS